MDNASGSARTPPEKVKPNPSHVIGFGAADGKRTGLWTRIEFLFEIRDTERIDDKGTAKLDVPQTKFLRSHQLLDYGIDLTQVCNLSVSRAGRQMTYVPSFDRSSTTFNLQDAPKT